MKFDSLSPFRDLQKFNVLQAGGLSSLSRYFRTVYLQLRRHEETSSYLTALVTWCPRQICRCCELDVALDQECPCQILGTLVGYIIQLLPLLLFLFAVFLGNSVPHCHN